MTLNVRAGCNRVTVALAGLALAAGMASCSAIGPTDGRAGAKASSPTSDVGFHGNLLDPPLPRPDALLTDTSSRHFDPADRPADEVTVLFFGFTHCRDVCPTTMADLAAALRTMPSAIRQHVLVGFITVDPARDTPQTLRHWLDRYDRRFVGLRGPRHVLVAAERSLYAPVSHVEATRASSHQVQTSSPHPGPYQMSHSGTVYVFAPGRRSLIYTGGTTPAQYAEDLTRLAGPP